MNYIICPVRNGLAMTRDAVDTFRKQDIGNVRIIVIDNASEDGTTEWLLAQDDIAVFHRNPPLSVAASWNAGLRHVFDRLWEPYALVVNNDVKLRPDTYRHLVADGGPFVTAVGTRNPKKIEPPYLDPEPQKKRPFPDYSAYLIRRECWIAVGEFDEGYKGAYVEDAAHHLAMHRAGITAYALELPFLHYGASTIKHASPEEVRAIQIQADRNRALFMERHGVAVGSPEYYALFGHDAGPKEEDATEAAED